MQDSSNNFGDQISSTITNDLHNTIMDTIMVMNNNNNDELPTTLVPQANAVSDQQDTVTKMRLPSATE